MFFSKDKTQLCWVVVDDCKEDVDYHRSHYSIPDINDFKAGNLIQILDSSGGVVATLKAVEIPIKLFT